MLNKNFLFVLFSFTGFVFGLRIINATIPSIIERDKDVLLTCEHDTEGDTLYSLKWYKGMREFFRYTPKEIPSTKIFSTKGINIDVGIFPPEKNCYCWSFLFCNCPRRLIGHQEPIFHRQWHIPSPGNQQKKKLWSNPCVH